MVSCFLDFSFSSNSYAVVFTSYLQERKCLSSTLLEILRSSMDTPAACLLWQNSSAYVPSLGHTASGCVLITSLLLSQEKSFPSLQIWASFLHSLINHLQKLVLAIVESSTRSQPLGGGCV